MFAKIAWLLGGISLITLATVMGLFCLFGWEAVETGANVGGWLSLFIPGVVVPLLAAVFCFYQALASARSLT